MRSCIVDPQVARLVDEVPRLSFELFLQAGGVEGGLEQGNGTVTLVTNWFGELNRLVPTDP